MLERVSSKRLGAVSGLLIGIGALLALPGLAGWMIAAGVHCASPPCVSPTFGRAVVAAALGGPVLFVAGVVGFAVAHRADSS